MPVYEYCCVICGVVEDHVVPFEYRLDPKKCKKCPGMMNYQFTPVTNLAPEVKRGDSRLIWSEKQLDQRWRDKGVTGPGGAGKTIYFHD